MGTQLIEESNGDDQVDVKALDFLYGGGEMGKLIRAKDWSETALGSPDTWPQSLRTTVSLCIASNFPIAIAWGPSRVQIYNDGYWPITGDMHPRSMGQDFKECWKSAWPVIGQAFEEASVGKTRFLENQHIFLDRYGYKEETFFTFSFSPILDESGAVGGLFHPVIELTQQTLAERRLNILSTLANHTVEARTADEASVLIMKCLKEFEQDLPFVLLYALSADGKEAHLDGCAGIDRESPLAPLKSNLEEQVLKGWPFSEAIQNGKVVLVERLPETFGTFQCGPYPEQPNNALVFPIIIPSAAHNKYLLVAGVSSRRILDEKYLLFYELLAESVTNVLTKASAYEEERRKVEALAEIDKAKTVFFSNISHEFRTPLTLMLSPLEELLNQKENNLNETAKGYVQTTHRNAIRLLKLVNTLLDFSRIESGREQAVFSLVDISVLTKNLVSNFRSLIEKAGLQLIVKAESIQPVYVDRQMWEKIVFNLLSNAFKYTLNGKITVELNAEKDFAVLKVTDTGVGIPENELPRMFERFHRVQNVTGRTYEGTGIGLSLIKELVVMHHGTINVESELSKGSVFTVKIPFGKDHLDAHQISKTGSDLDEISSNIYVEEIETLLETQKQDELKSSSVIGKNLLPIILVVDDNADMREHISSILSNSFNVITANNGMDALHKMRTTIPSLVLSDIMMPVMDGMGLLKEIKGNKSTENIPVIFLTARAGEESKIEGWETGADDYLVKPFSSKELISRISSQIKTQQIRAASEIMLKNIFMQAPVAISVIEVPSYKYLLINTEAQELFSRSAEKVLDKSVKEIFPEAEAQGLIGIIDQVVSTGVTYTVNEMPLMLNNLNDGVLRQCYLNFSVEPIINAEEKVHSVLIVCIDITQQVETRKRTEENEQQQSFLLKLSDTLRPLDNPGVIEETVTKMSLDFMDADRCYYSTIQGDNVIIIHDAYRRDLPSVAGVHSIANFALYKAILNAGHPFVVDDVHTSNLLDENLKEVCLQFGYGSFINVPVIKNGQNVGLFSVVERKPRKWKDSELQLTIETAERTWAAVERAKAEEALRKSEEQLAIELIDAKKLQAISTQLIHEDNFDLLYEQLLTAATDMMHADMASIQVYHAEKKQLQLLAHKGYHPASAAHWVWVSTDSKSACGTAMKRGVRCIVADVEKDERTASIENLHYYQLSGIRAVQSTPLISRNGILLGMISTLWREPHQPSERDLQLFDVLARQAADLIERKKSIEKLKESEAKYRNLFNTMDQGFCIVEVIFDNNNKAIDYSFVEVNPMFEKHTGLKNALGKTAKILLPELEEKWFEIYGNVALTGKPSRFVEVSEVMQRWFEVYAFRNGDHDSRRVAILFTDISEQVKSRKKIEESEKYFRQLTDAVPAIIWITDPDGSCSYLNKPWYDFTGQTEEEAKGFGWLEAIHPDDKEASADIFIKANAAQKPFNISYRLRGSKGEYRWAIDSGSPKFNADNVFVGMIGTVVDVHEEKLAEEKLAYRTALLEAHNEANVDGLLLVDAKGKIISYNQRFVEIWDMPQHIVDAKDDEAALSFAMTQLVNPQQFIDKVKYLYEHPKETSIDELEFKNGKIVERNGYPVVGEDSIYYAWSWTFRDITVQKNHEKILIESQERFHSLAQTLPQLVWVTDELGNMEFASLRWKEYSGVEPGGEEEWKALVHPDDYDNINAAWMHSLSTGEIYNADVRLKNKNGEYRWHRVIGKSVLDTENKIVKWVGAFTDIHPEKLFKQDLELKVKMRTSELEQFNIELEKKNKELESFAYISSHDLQEPLRKIQIFATRIIAKEYEALSESGKDNFKRMQDAANRMQTLIQDLLVYSRTSTTDSKLEDTDLNDIIDEVKEDLSEEIKSKHATIEAIELCNLKIIPFQFRQLMYNLVGNALKFSVPTKPPHIIIKSKIAEGSDFDNPKLNTQIQYCHITVSDNGIGFEQQYEEKIFEVFQRLHERNEYHGTGIGLSIVKKIVENHKGIITAKSELKKGATFDIFIPVA